LAGVGDERVHATELFPRGSEQFFDGGFLGEIRREYKRSNRPQLLLQLSRVRGIAMCV
jgi:hypothetical protein